MAIPIDLGADFGDVRLAQLDQLEVEDSTPSRAAAAARHAGEVAAADRPKQVTALSAVWNFSNSCMGVGMLSLSSAFAEAGVVVSVGLVVAFAVITFISVQLLVDTAVFTAAPSYEEMARRLSGTIAERYMQVCLLGAILFGSLGRLVVVKGLAAFSASKMIGMPFDAEHEQAVLLMAVVVVLVPMSFLRSLDAMQYTSLLSVLCLLWFVALSVFLVPIATREHWFCASMPEHPVDRSAEMYPPRLQGCLTALSIIMGSYLCHFSVFPLWTEMRSGDAAAGLAVQHTRSKFRYSVMITVILCTCANLGAALSGYFTWFKVVLQVDLIIECYDPESWYMLFTYIGLTMVCLFSYPLLLFVGRSMILRVMGYPDPNAAPCSLFTLVGLGLITATTIPALFLSNLGFVLALGCAIIGPPIILEMPAYCALQIPGTPAYRQRCWALLCFGVVVHFLIVVFFTY